MSFESIIIEDATKAPVFAPFNIPLEEKLVAPVPPLFTGSVPVTCVPRFTVSSSARAPRSKEAFAVVAVSTTNLVPSPTKNPPSVAAAASIADNLLPIRTTSVDPSPIHIFLSTVLTANSPDAKTPVGDVPEVLECLVLIVVAIITFP